MQINRQILRKGWTKGNDNPTSLDKEFCWNKELWQMKVVSIDLSCSFFMPFSYNGVYFWPCFKTPLDEHLTTRVRELEASKVKGYFSGRGIEVQNQFGSWYKILVWRANSYSSGLHISVFQDRSKKGRLICLKKL